MEVQINDELHKVVYIEYRDNLPHEVLTVFYVPNAVNGPYWRLVCWDFFPNNGDNDDIRYYQSGSGGDMNEIQASQFIDGYVGEYWMSDEASFKGEPKNAKRLAEPIPLKVWDGSTTSNPFDAAEETYSREYCMRCGHESTEICGEHMYDDDEGELRYKDDNSVV